MHEAYTVHSPTHIMANIESMNCYENKIIIGTRAGHLFIYEVDQKSEINKKHELQLLLCDRNFSKKPIVQVEVIPDYKLLFSLFDSVLNVHNISTHNCPFLNSFSQTKGATLFAMDVNRPKTINGEITLVVRICVAVKRKLQLYYWKNNQIWEFAPDIDLPDVPRAMLWSENSICIGFKTEYIIYDISDETPKKRELFPTSSSRAVEPCISMIKNCFAVTKDEYLIAVDPKSKSLQELASGTAADFAKSTENAAKTFKPLVWSQPLQVLAWDEPYAVALVNNTLEVHVVDTSGSSKETFIQTFSDLHKARFLVRAKPGLLFAASITQVWCIELVDITKQRQSLLQQKKFQIALQLTDISDESDSVKAETKHQIQTLYAFDLFANKFFKESMEEFFKLGTDPCDVIRLFPDLMPQGSSPKSSSAAAIEPTPNLPKLEDRDLEHGLLALINYLVEVRYKFKKELSSSSSPQSAGFSDRKPFGKNVTSILSIIDTILLKCYLQTNDSFVASLLRLNYCHLDESEKILKQYDKYPELIILYQTNGQHKKALQLLQSQADVADSTLAGHERTIQYLQHLGQAHKQIVFEFAGWVLERHPEDGLKIFTENVSECESLSRAEVLDYLLKGHEGLVIPYLQHVIHAWNEDKPMFQNILIHQYRKKLDLIKLEMQSGQESEKATLLYEDVRKKLRNFLQTSNNYALESVLKNFPYNDLFEERAIILGKLGKHEKVLAIYVQILGDVDSASAYCESVYQSDKKNDSIYVSLIRTLLVPPTAPPYSDVPLHPSCLKPNVTMALELLEKNATKVDPYAVLQILPDSIPLFRLKSFLELALNHQLERRRKNQILKGLLYAENLQAEEQRMHYESKSFVMTELSICPVCNKKFTNQSAFVRYPNGRIVHYLCQDKVDGE